MSSKTTDLLRYCITNAHLLLLPFLPGIALQDNNSSYTIPKSKKVKKIQQKCSLKKKAIIKANLRYNMGVKNIRLTI